MLRLSFSTIALAALLTGPALADIRIMAVGPMTGPYQALGRQIEAGVRKAADDINAAGGIGGERLVVDVEDDACKAEQAVAAANRAAGRGDVLAVGHLCAEAAGAAAAVYAQAGIVAISPGVSAAAFTDKRAGPMVFRLAARDEAQGRVAGAYLASLPANARITLLQDGSPYGKTLVEAAKAVLDQAGRRVRSEDFDPGLKDYGALADRLIADGTDFVFVGGYPGDTALILKALRAKGSKAILTGGDALGTGDFSTAAGPDTEGTQFTFPRDWSAAPEAAGVASAMRAAKIEPEGLVLPAYAAVQLFAAARTATGSSDAAALAGAIASATTPTVIGPVAFDGKGDADIVGFAVYRWQNGAVVPAGPPQAP